MTHQTKLHDVLIQKMRAVLINERIKEASASGIIILGADKPVLFPGAVYGFAAILKPDDKLNLFHEATNRGLTRLNSPEEFNPIVGNLYPLYWGKDKYLGARAYQHIYNPQKTGSIRLSTYRELKNKEIICASITVESYVNAEIALKDAFPDLLKTSTQKFTT
ncbi:hypothetical protein [Holophaga foetida]|uniref:hypothetical protein n=1 Tax=Holophaga foetida TaxID=35839 RepID=UPI0011DCEB31|nr:hypothetical protein [Holophaga foetida]